MIKKLDWDSEFFEFEVGEFDFNKQQNTDHLDNFDLLYLKSDSDFEATISNFTNNFSEVKVVFVKQIVQNVLDNNNLFSVDKINYQINEIYELAYESGKFSRFFLDKNFKTNKFYDLYKKWVDNSVSKSIADDVVLYIDKNRIIGFVTYKSSINFATIGLIAVDINHQGKGIGKKLLQFVENKLLKNNIIALYIPTQKSNEKACSFYKKQGYSIHKTTFIKHYWRDDTI